MRGRRLIPLVLLLLLGSCAAPAAQELPGDASQAMAAVSLPPARPEPAPEPASEPDPEPEPEPPGPEEQAAAIAAAMTAEERTGQVFFARFPESGAPELARELHLGGYLLFGRDFKDSTPEQVRETVAACQQAASLPLLMGVDEEGGTVVRASFYPAFRERRFPSPQRLYASGGLEAVEADALEKSAFLLDLGLNVNLAPVCDVSADPEDFIYDRAFGRGAEETAEYVSVVVSAMGRAGIGSVMKHFPGYGNNRDTHTGSALDRRAPETILKEDLLPFRAGAEAGAGAALVCHNIVACLDGTLPASLSPAAYRLLRNQGGFDGVAMTDDLDMKAVRQYVREGSAAVMALNAGADMVITGDPAAMTAQVLAALEDGRLDPARLEEAAARVICWKLRLGLIPAA